MSNIFQIKEREPISFAASISPRAFIWKALTAAAGITVREPTAALEVTGTLESPSGTFHLGAAEIAPLRTNKPAPALTDFELDLQLDRNRARITRGELLVQGQPVELTAELPIDRQFWDDWHQKKFNAWKRASGRLIIQDAELAPFSDLYPTILTPQGRLALDVTLNPGPNFKGQFVLQGARTRPIGDLGPVRDINIQAEFNGHNLRLDSAKAKVGGSEVIINGEADLSGSAWLHGSIPPFQCTISGLNVPLSRKPESIIRSDLNLLVSKTNSSPPSISGTARLVNSFFLTDLATLGGGRLAAPQARPPYFSIDDPLLANCPLAVKVTGDHFLQVRSPIFNGQISANINLQGTLKNPLAIGDVRIDSGVVRFPFANLEVQQGFVTLSPENPYQPQLSVNAATKQFGYDIKMEATGAANAPIIQFTSNPPLSSEEILLMVSAGQMPRQEQVLSTQQRAQTFAMFLGKDLLSKLGFGDESEQRLTVYSGEEITQQGTPTYRIEYKLSDRWSVLGEYDRFNEYNLGMKWRFYSK
jgi:translocation and assembly module TamB